MSRETILVYAPSWIGDAVMSLAAVRALKRARPGSSLVVLARPWVADLYDAVEEVDSRLGYDRSEGDRGARGFFRAARRIATGAFDAALLLPNAFRAAALVRLAGIPERWGYATESRGFLLTKKVPPAPRPFGRHQVYYYLELLTGLGFPAGEPDARLQATESMRRRARALLEAEGWDGRRPLVGVHPGAAGSRAKMWKASRYAEVLGKLARSSGARLVVIGGPGEHDLAEEIRRGLHEPPLLLQGKTSLGELIGALAEMSLFLTNDSGPMHLAAALGTPTVAVFGPTDPKETGPFGAGALVVREPVDCSPCLYRDCPIDHRCMDRIDVERVYRETRGLLGARLSLQEAAPP